MNRRQVRRQRAALRLCARAGVVMTPHALARQAEHGFTDDEVYGAVAAPEQTYPGGPGHASSRRTYQRGRVAVIVDETSRAVITVLPRVRDRWEHAQAACSG